jgi:chaperonin GroES
MPCVSQSKNSHLNVLPDGRLGDDQEIFDRGAIRRLYESDQYPLARRAATVPVRPLNNSSELKETPMKFRPLHDRVVIERIDAETKSAGGVIIPDTAQEKPQQGEVIAVGPGGRDESGKLIPIDVKVGNRILFGKWSGTEVKIDGVDYLIMKESDIMGVLGEADAKMKAA